MYIELIPIPAWSTPPCRATITVGVRDEKPTQGRCRTRYFLGLPGKRINVDLLRFDCERKDGENIVSPFSNSKLTF